MREATGELNITVVVVTLVAVLVAFFYGVIWPNVKGGLSYTQNCNNVICDKKTYDRKTGKVECRYKAVGEDNSTGKPIKCPWKG